MSKENPYDSIDLMFQNANNVLYSAIKKSVLFSAIQYLNELIRRDQSLFNEMIEKRIPLPADHRWIAPKEPLGDRLDIEVIGRLVDQTEEGSIADLGPLGFLSGFIRIIAGRLFPEEVWTIVVHFDDSGCPIFAKIRLSKRNGHLIAVYGEEDFFPKEAQYMTGENLKFSIQRIIDDHEKK